METIKMKKSNIVTKVINFIKDMWPILLILLIIYFLAIMAKPQ